MEIPGSTTNRQREEVTMFDEFAREYEKITETLKTLGDRL